MARAFFAEVMAEAGRRRLLSDDHFSVDGTLLEAWASLKSYRPRDEQEPPSSGAGRNAEVDFRGQRSQSRDARLAHRRGGAALPQGTAAGGEAALPRPRPQREPSRAGGGRGAERGERLYGEREAALQMLERSVRGRATLGADRGYDTRDFVAAVRARGVTPPRGLQQPWPPPRHRRAHDAARGLRTEPAASGAGGAGLRLAEDRGRGRKLRYIGRQRNRAWLELTAAAYNLVRISRLEPVPL